jgi:phosphatidylserine decarboxylase
VSDRLSVLPQYLLPKRALTVWRLVATRRYGAATTRLIKRWFVRQVPGVNMAEAAEPGHPSYDLLQRIFHPRAEGRRAAAGAALT